jgi:hypothetical protein
VGGALALFAHFIGPTVLRLHLTRRLHDTLFYIGLAIVAYGIFLTVVPTAWTPFSAKFALPRIGWAGVFSIAIIFDFAAAAIAFFGLRRMSVPAILPSAEPLPAPKPASVAAH